MVDAATQTLFDIDMGRMRGVMQERMRIIELLANDEVLHNIWWRIKREDTFPSQNFISDVIYEELKLGGRNDRSNND